VNVWRAPFAFLAFLGAGATAPVVYHWVWVRPNDLPMEAQFLATFTLPAVLLLFLASWMGG
jgi:hypothetical protein